MSSQVWWNAARAGGILAWALASLSVVWGLQLSTRLVRKPPPAWVLDLHRFLGGLAVLFTGVHLGGLFLDTQTHFGPAQLLVPFTSSFRPGAVALGIVAMYLLVAVELTSLVVKRMPRRIWHAVHLSAFGVFLLGTVHGLLAGTDATNSLFQWAVVAVSAVVLFLTLVRVLAPRRGAPAAREKATRTARTA
ncbi:MAG: ferric reductase-like transmembrane domain-containing protein [Acidimicrobiia bacterium]